MQYVVTKKLLGQWPQLPISVNEFEEIKDAQHGLIFGLLIEERFDCLLENYAEFEDTILTLSNRQMIFRGNKYSSNQNIRSTICRRITNLLSTCRAYTDQTKNDLENNFGKNSKHYSFYKEELTAKRENILSFRVMEALRNHVQHHGLPFHHISFNIKLDENNESISHTIVPSIKIEYLQKDQKFNKTILNELGEIDSKLDVRPIIRQYIEGLSDIHVRLRKETDARFAQWDSLIVKWIKKYKASSESAAGLAAMALNDDKSEAESVSIFPEIIEYRKELIRKNSSLVNLDRRYVSNLSMTTND